MNVHVKPRMTVDQYLAWAMDQPKRCELMRGEIYEMSPQTAGHAETKYAVHKALEEAIRKSGTPCHVLPDGMTVKVDEHTAYEPDAVVYCGEKLKRSVVVVPEPIIIVEVLSTLTQRIDTTAKLSGYFQIPSVMHYLIFDSSEPEVVHHARVGGTILTSVVASGGMRLDPPGLEFSLSDIYGA